MVSFQHRILKHRNRILLNWKLTFEVQEASYRAAQQATKSAEFNVASAQANLKEIKTSLNRTTISSPTNGIVSKLNVEQGERVVGTMQMAGTEMMRVANFNSMEVQVEVSENDILPRFCGGHSRRGS
jgi:HlyD family secretion protein